MSLYLRSLLGASILLAFSAFAVPAIKKWNSNRPHDSGQGLVFKAKLIHALESSNEIRIVEHSDLQDFLNQDDELPPHPPHFDYRSKALSAEERADLLKQLRQLDPASTYSPPFCLFYPHHRLEFGGSGTSSVEICFKCEQIQWQGNYETPPDALIPVLSSFLDQSGFPPKRDWGALAAEAQRRDANASSP